jgi:hypothetical protein
MEAEMADRSKPAPCWRRHALRDAVHARGGQPDGTGRRLWASDLWHAQLVPDGSPQPASRAAGRAGKPRCVDSVAVVLRPADSGQGPAGRGRRSRCAAGGVVAGSHAVCQCELRVRSPPRASARDLHSSGAPDAEWARTHAGRYVYPYPTGGPMPMAGSSGAGTQLPPAHVASIYTTTYSSAAAAGFPAPALPSACPRQF